MPFDLRPMGYSLDDAQAFLSALGDVGRAQYQGPQRSLDLVYPCLMGASLALAAWLFTPRFWALPVITLAVLAAGFDLAENRAVAELLVLGADGIDVQDVTRASQASLLKSVATMLAMLILLVGLGHAFWRRRQARR